MAIVHANAPVDFINGRLPDDRYVERGWDYVLVSDDFDDVVFEGNNFSYSGPYLVGGTVTGFEWYYGNTLALEIREFAAYAPTVADYVFDQDLVGLLSYVLAYDDDIFGSAYSDRLAGFDGDDFFDPAGGDDDVYGGRGVDLVFLAGSLDDYAFASIGTNAYEVIDFDLGDGDEGIDHLFDVELVQFSNGQVHAIADLLGRTPWYDQPANIEVVAATYQFFTERVPTGTGFEYLISSLANPNDLNDPYYAQFNIENRYINFSSNLGTAGEGAAFFDAVFGGLSFTDTVRTAYLEIVGQPLTDAALAFFLNAESYYRAVGAERAVRPGVDLFEATKIVAIGSILNEAIKSDAGPYADAIDQLVADVAGDGTSPDLGHDLFA